MKKFLMSLFVAVIFSAVANAQWVVPSKNFSHITNNKGERLSAPAPAGGENAFVLTPLVNVYSNFASLNNNSGGGFAYVLGYVNLAPDPSNPNNVVVNPYGYLGVCGDLNLSPWVTSGGTSPITARAGFIAGLPALGQGFPQFAFIYDTPLSGGPWQINFAASVPTDILSNLLVHKL